LDPAPKKVQDVGLTLVHVMLLAPLQVKLKISVPLPDLVTVKLVVKPVW
jgi:hypothetical protein